jgi:hypothetical protein
LRRAAPIGGTAIRTASAIDVCDVGSRSVHRGRLSTHPLRAIGT